MGVLFGLAMDYEVFLVSADARRTTSTAGDAQHAIRTGFISSARVVTAAAIIMISVFAASSRDGSATIKPIALGLAVGVFVDAFLVRMTLVPAVLALLGKNGLVDPANWLDRVLPGIDVEGQSLVKHVEQAEWDEANPGVAVRAEPLLLGPARARSRSTCRCRRDGVHGRARRPALAVRAGLDDLGLAQTGRRDLAVLGRVLPEESGFVRKKVRVVPAPSRGEDALTVRRYLRGVRGAVEEPVVARRHGGPGSRPGRGLAGPMAEAESRSRCGSRTASWDI